MGGKTRRGPFGDRRRFPKARERVKKAINEKDHRTVARIGVKMGASILGLDSLVTGIETTTKAYEVYKKHGVEEAKRAAVIEVAKTFAASGTGELVAGLAGSSLNEDQRRIVSAAVSATTEEMLGPIIDKTEGWE